MLLSGSVVDEPLTWSAFVPNNEVSTAAWTLVSPKHAAVDEDLTVPSVLALVQHFLKDRRWTITRRELQIVLKNEQKTVRPATVTPKTTLKGEEAGRGGKKKPLESFPYFLEPCCFFGFI